MFLCPFCIAKALMVAGSVIKVLRNPSKTPHEHWNMTEDEHARMLQSLKKKDTYFSKMLSQSFAFLIPLGTDPALISCLEWIFFTRALVSFVHYGYHRIASYKKSLTPVVLKTTKACCAEPNH